MEVTGTGKIYVEGRGRRWAEARSGSEMRPETSQVPLSELNVKIRVKLVD